MAVLDPLHPLQSLVLEMLLERGGMRIADIAAELRTVHGMTVSRPTLYRLLAQLHEHQCIVRSRGSVALHRVWSAHLLHLAELVRQRSVASEVESLHLDAMREKESKTYYADSLIDLDPVWSQTIMELVQVADTRKWYVYNSHPWYSIGMRETETRLYAGLVAVGVDCHLLYGNDTFLDKYGDRMIRVPGFKTAIGADVPFLREGQALWSCGDFIIECVFPPAISRHFAFFFQSVQSIADFDPAMFTDIFRMKARCKVSVRRDRKEAERIRAMIAPSFQKDLHPAPGSS